MSESSTSVLYGALCHSLPTIQTLLFKVLSENKNVRNFCVRNFKASEIFRDLIVLLRYFSKPISSFSDENVLIYSFLGPLLVYRMGSIVVVLVRQSVCSSVCLSVRPSVCQSVFKYLGDRSLVFI